MKFGKLDNIEGVDFSLPPDPPANEALLKKLPPSEQSFFFYIGCTGWSMPEWVGKVYPTGTKSRDFLLHYTRQFNTIELNTTHYRIPHPSMVEKWRTSSREDFRFCPKIPQVISHSRDLGLGGSQIEYFCQNIRGLGPKLGSCFLQLPPHFGPDKVPLLEKFIDRFPADIPLSIEFRHESWFEARSPGPQRAMNKMEERGIGTVITDVAGRRDVLHMRLTNGWAMVRFVGNDLHPTDFLRVDRWLERIEHWRSRGLAGIYFFTHEPDNLQAPELAAHLYHKIENWPGIQSRGPQLIDPEDERQLSLF